MTPIRLDLGERPYEVAQAFRQLPSKESLGISDMNRLDQTLRSTTVVVQTRGLATDAPLLVVGRAPEFYAPIRSALLRTDDGGALAEIAEVVSSAASVWPRELAPDAFRRATSLASVVPALVDISDRCGLLGTLLDAATGISPANKAVADVRRLHRSFVAAWVRSRDDLPPI